MKIAAFDTLAAAATCTAQTGLALQAPDVITAHNKNIRLLRYISSLNGLSALIIFSTIFLFRQSFYGVPAWSGWMGYDALIILAAGIGLLLLFMKNNP